MTPRFPSLALRILITTIGWSFYSEAFLSSPLVVNKWRHRMQNIWIEATGAGPTEEQPAEWDSDSLIYKNGIVPSHHDSMTVDELLLCNGGNLKLFGYGSLCWNPGTDGVLSLAKIPQDEQHLTTPMRKVTTTPGSAIGYQRCWAQRSADHRGTSAFNGIVCTLLSDQEIETLHRHHYGTNLTVSGLSRTEGLIYTVDATLVKDCLDQLDFREKGGYARDVIDVVERDTGNTVKALLYRGTPKNPAFWNRVVFDLPLAAAIISVANGPSGPNDDYLLHLDSFLTHTSEQHSTAFPIELDNHRGDLTTGKLAKMLKLLKTNYRPYFLFGAGSNQHNQLLLSNYLHKANYSTQDNKNEVIKSGTEDVPHLTEMLLVVPRHDPVKTSDCTTLEGIASTDSHVPLSLHLGGGHSAMITHGGDLYLWGWNDAGQLGRLNDSISLKSSHFNAIVMPLPNIKVATASLGHAHTLIIEKQTGKLFGFGDNGRGQVDGCTHNTVPRNLWHVPRNLHSHLGEKYMNVSAGLFHSAAITVQGELITWGCRRFGQCTLTDEVDCQQSLVGRWKPSDGSKVVQVACGRRHTVILDDIGRVWTLGENKYGQLGQLSPYAVSKRVPKFIEEPQLVEGSLGKAQSGCFAIACGWSHVLALVRHGTSEAINLYGWGRSDKGQLGVQPTTRYIATPQLLNPCSGNDTPILIDSVCCGAESSQILDINGVVYSCGWNEHGNLGIGLRQDCMEGDSCSRWVAVSGAKVVCPPPVSKGRILFGSGGAHMIVMSTN